MTGLGGEQGESAAVVTAVRTGDQAAFDDLVRRYRRPLQAHCYRMTGSAEESEDLVQDTFLRAWRSHGTFTGRASVRAWLYRIATNVCLDALAERGASRRPTPVGDSRLELTAAGTPWLQPYPDRLLEPADPDAEPDVALVAKETLELAFLAAIQHLPPRQRAVVILRDVLGWPAKDTADVLDTSTASVKSALQRARPVLARRLPPQRSTWTRPADPTAEERDLLQRYMHAHEHQDPAAFAELVSSTVQLTMPPHPVWVIGRDELVAFTENVFDPASPDYHGQWRCVPTAANRQPAVAMYVRRPADTVFRAQLIDVLRIEDGSITEITAFEPRLFPLFGLRPTL